MRLLDRAVEVIERNEREIDAALKRSAALRQAIVKKPSPAALSPKSPPTNPPLPSSPGYATGSKSTVYMSLICVIRS
ncbi:MAG: hypothetical protein JNG82_01500 [Opitutaceae bacterium]|nr:hypothetical protein [Opitutaceae bacterium]